jgi:RimJ/RimL family protein N-acetyltransferase
MAAAQRWSVSWPAADGVLVAREARAAEVGVASAQLAAWYNEDYNRSMLSNTEALDAADVREYYGNLREEGGRGFLLYADERLLGDADLRHLDLARGTGEFAILIGERAVQGRGFGTRFALMLHALAFLKLGLERLYVAIIPANRGSLRLFEKLGYQPDDSPAARTYVDEADDRTLSFARADFLRLHGEILPALRFAPELPEP